MNLSKGIFGVIVVISVLCSFAWTIEIVESERFVHPTDAASVDEKERASVTDGNSVIEPNEAIRRLHEVDNNSQTEGTRSSSNPKPSGTVTVWSEDFEGAFPGSWAVGDGNATSGNDYWDDTSYKSYSGSWSGWSAEIGSQTTTTTILYEGFEGAFPGSWAVGDGNAISGNDYWDDTSYKSYSGSWSGWSAEIGSQTTTTTILYEDFEGVFPGSWTVGDSDGGSGEDYWADISQRSYGGSWSGWCADIGWNDVYGDWNSNVHKYDNDMDSYMYHSVSLGSYSSVTLSYYYWLDSESEFDYLRVIYYDGSWNYIDSHTGNSGGWQFSSVSIPTSATAVGFHFASDSSFVDEGAYVDNARLVGTQTVSNSAIHQYDNDMDSYMYHSVSLGSYSSVTLSYYYWLDSESEFDYLRVIYYDGSWNYIDSHTGNSGGWQFSSVSIPTSATEIGFHFYSDSSVHDYEGAYVDEVLLEGISVVSNSAIHQYDNDMDAYMYRSASLSGYSSVTLSYYYWLDSESGFDYLRVIYYDGSWNYIDSHTGNSGGWQFSSVSIPTSATEIGFHFYSDSSVHDYEGAYLDEIQLVGTIPTYSVTITTNPDSRDIIVDGATYTAPQTFSWDDGSSHTIGVTSPQTVGTTRYVFSSWSDGGAQTHSITVTGSTTYTAYFNTEYQVTIDTSPSGREIVVDGTTYTAPQSFWWEDGATHTVDVPSPQTVGMDTRYVFDSWSDGGAQTHTVTVTEATTHTATFTTQYYLTVDSAYGTTSGESWYDAGTTAYAGLDMGIYTVGDTRYVFAQWTGDGSGTDYSQSNPIVMTGPKTVTAEWTTQYEITIATNPAGLEIIVDLNTYTAPQSFWWDDESTYDIGVSGPQPGETGVQYVYASWSDGGAQSHSITVIGADAITANFLVQYEITIEVQDGNGPLLGINVSIDSSFLGTTPYTDWYDAESSYNIEVETPVTISGTEYEFVSWNFGSTDNPVIYTVSGPAALIANYQEVTEGPYFIVSVSPPSRQISPGEPATYDVTVTSFSNYAGTVVLSVTSLPGMATSTFSPASLTLTAGATETSSLTIDNTGAVAAGTYTLTIIGDDGVLIDSGNADLVVVVTTPFFRVSVTPSSVLIAPGETAIYTVTVQSFNGYEGNVTLSVTGLPGVATGIFDPLYTNLTAGGSETSSLTVDNTGDVADGSYTLTISGNDGALSDSTQVTVIVAGMGTISGRVVDQNDEPLEYATVELLSDTTVVAAAVTDSDGEFCFTDVISGTYTVRASLSGYEEDSETVTLATGGEETVDLQLPKAAAPGLGALADYWWVILVIIIVIVVAIMILLMKRRKPREELDEQPQAEEVVDEEKSEQPHEYQPPSLSED